MIWTVIIKIYEGKVVPRYMSGDFFFADIYYYKNLDGLEEAEYEYIR